MIEDTTVAERRNFVDCYYTVNVTVPGASISINTGDEELMGRLIHAIKEQVLDV